MIYTMLSKVLTLSPLYITSVVRFLISLCTFVSDIANNLDPDQTAPLGFIVFASLVIAFWSAYQNMRSVEAQ